MRNLRCFLYLLAIHGVLGGSFYDNPEQDHGYNQAVLNEPGNYDWSKDELEKRWGQDVKCSLSALKFGASHDPLPMKMRKIYILRRYIEPSRLRSHLVSAFSSDYPFPLQLDQIVPQASSKRFSFREIH